MARTAVQNVYSVGIENMEEVAAALGDFEKKMPAVVKGAVNDTAKYARKMMISSAKKRYALSSTGRAHVSDLVQNRKATVSDTRASLYVKSLRNDLAYFSVRPRQVITGMDVFKKSPKYFRGRVLSANPPKRLTGDSAMSKGFLLEFKSGHVGAVQRQLGVSTDLSKYSRTKSGAKRWKSASGKVEKLRTMSSPSITEMHGVVWREVAPRAQEYLNARVLERAREQAAKEAAKLNVQ